MRWTLLSLIALLGADWALVEQHALRNGRHGLPVRVTLSPRADSAELSPGGFDEGSIQVWRVSPSGRLSPLVRLPGAAAWVGTRREWLGGIRIELPEAKLRELGAIEVRLGEQRFEYAANAIARAWSPTATADRRWALISPQSLRLPRSALGMFAAIINWPGDAAMLRTACFGEHAARIALLGLLLLASFRLDARRTRDRTGDYVTRAVVLAVIAYSVLGVLPTIGSRLSQVLSIEHLEGVQALGTWALMNGEGLYQIPNARHAGNIYTPGYYLVSAAWASLFGLSLPVLRALTLLLLAITAFSAAAIARQLTGRARDGLLWLPLYLLMFDYYAWIDNANKDPLHTALAMAGFAVLATGLRDGSTRRGDTACALAGLIWSFAFMTKQSHVTAVAATLACLLFVARRQFWITGFAFAVSCLALTGLSLWAWGEQYWLWTFEIPGGHKFSFSVLGRALVGFAAVAAGYFVIAGQMLVAHDREGDGIWATGSERIRYAFVAFLVGSLFTGFMSVGKDRGGPYALMPGIAAIAVLVSIALMRKRDLKSALAYPLLLLAMSNPFDRWVSERDHRAADALIARVAAESGDVWVPYYGWINIMAGKPPNVALFCVEEWTASGREFPSAVLASLEQQRFSLVITDLSHADLAMPNTAQEPFRTLALHYRAESHIEVEDAFVPEDGWASVPRVLWRPKPPSASSAGK